MSNEERCDCCKRYWYFDDLVSGLCPNCLDFLATKNQMNIEQDQKIKELEHRLANCLEPKFKQGDYFIEYWDNTPIIYQCLGKNRFKCLNKKQGYHCDYVILGALLLGEDFIKPITEEDALKKLEEIKNG